MGRKDQPKPDPSDPNEKAWGGNTDEGQCRRCGGRQGEWVNGKWYDCRECGGSGKR